MILSRREAWTGGFAIAAAMSIGAGAPAWAAQRRRPLFDLERKALGIQLYMLGDELAKDVSGTFATLALLGYRRIEGDVDLISTPQIRTAAQANGLSCTSVHISPIALLPEAETGYPALVDAAAATGARHAGISIFPFSPALLQGGREPINVTLARIGATMTADDWKRTADLLNKRAAPLAKAGLRFFYHNHNVEFRPFEGGSTPFDLLMAYTDPALVSFELDVGWATAAGVDPIALLKAHRGRFRLMHVKDVAPATKINYAFEQMPADVGTGKLDFHRVIPAARQAGVSEFFVEQEPPFAGPRVDAAAVAATYLIGSRA